ncbi:MAG: outer membrane protein [Bacteroidetes bacterium]|nr:outer membrane protein [Bacteroidota bacterium]
MGFRGLNDTIDDQKKGVFVLPLLYYTPDTRWAAGAAGVYYFKIKGKNDDEKETRVSNVQFLSDYTQNKQLDVWGQWNIFTRNENYLFKGELRFRNFPDRFYGIGNTSIKKNEERYEYNLFSFKTLALKKVYKSVFVGVDYHFEQEYDFKYTDGGALQTGTITGYDGGIQSAIGLVGIYDSRDNVINTFKGSLFEVSSYFYLPQLGSTFNFTFLNLTHQKFWQVKKKHIIAIQTKARYGFGQVPFLDMSQAGNDDMLRGYPKNRFRDVNFLGTQIEYRFPLFWRLGGVTFAGAGDVFAKHKDLSLNTVKYSIGAGLRFVVNPAERLNIRLDYGYGREGGYFYFIVAEAF